MNDEFLNEKTNQCFSKAFNYLLITSLINIIFKLCFVSQYLVDYLVELSAICLSIGYLLIRLYIYQIKLFKPQDYYLHKIHSKLKTQSYFICLSIYLVGELIYLFILKKTLVASLYLPVWGLPTLVGVIKTKNMDVYSPDTKLSKYNVLKSLKIRTTLGSIAFGLCLCGKDIYYNNSFHTDGILWTFYSSISFGVIFYFFFKFFIINNRDQ